MEIKVCIDMDTIESNTETSSSLDEVTVAGSPFRCSHPPIFIGFCKKLIHLFHDRRNLDLKVTTSSTGESVTWVTIQSNTYTSPIFDLFKSMGMYMPKLTIGVSESTGTVYTSSKLCRDLSKYSEPQRAAVLMYMLTLAHFIKNAEALLVHCEFNGMSNVLKVPSDLDTFKKLLRPFVTEETWYIKDSNNDNYNAVTFFNTPNVHTGDQYANGDAVNISIAKHKSGNFVGIANASLGATMYTFVISEKVAYTNFDLCNIEISSDSVCAYVANAFPRNFNLRKSDKLPLTDMTLMELDGGELDEFLSTEKVPKWLASWIITMFGKGARAADSEHFSKLNKAYGVALPAGTSVLTAISADDMKKLYETDEYAQELYKQIKPYYETYNLGADLDANLKGFSNGALYSMAFVGESGTGKSTAARVLPARCGIPYISVNFSVNIEEADLFGSMVPNPKKLKPEDPEFVWTDGIITKAVRYGYCAILEEINFARPGVLGKLNSLLDENRQIDLSTGEIVRAHPNFRIIATCNIAYEGTNRFNKALINRFDDVTVFKDLERSAAIDVIKQRTKYTNTSKISKVYDVYEALKKFATEQNVNAVVSMRQLLNIFTKGKYYSSAKDAVQRIMINGAFIEDNEYQKVFEETVFKAFDLKFKI